MFFAKASLAAILLAAQAFAQSQLTINTPANAVVCQPLLLTWTGGTPPYFLSIRNGNDPNGAAIEDLGTQNGNSLTWVVNIDVGTSIGLNLRDSTGQVAQSAPFSVLTGSDRSCVGQSPSTSAGPSQAPTSGGSSASSGASTPASTSGAATTSAGTTTSAGATTTPATTPRPTSTAPSGSGTSRPATSAGSNTSSNAAAGPTQAAQIGAAGLVGAAVMALLA